MEKNNLLNLKFDKYFEPVSREDLKDDRIKSGHSGAQMLFVVIFGGTVGLFLTSVIVHIVTESGIGGKIVGSTLIGFSVLVIFLAYRSYLRGKRFHARVAKLADDNGLKFYQGHSPFRPGLYMPRYGAIYGYGDDQHVPMAFGNEDFSLATYRYVTGSGKNRHENNWLVGSIKLSKQLPHVLLDSKKNNIFGMSNLPQRFKANQLVTSETEFDGIFKLYAPEGYVIETLSFIAPDFIEILVKRFRNYDVEIVEDGVFIYRPGAVNSKNIIETLENMKLLAVELEDNISTFEASKTKEELAASQMGYQRLKSSNWLRNISVAIFVGYFLLQMFTITGSGDGTYINNGFIILVIIVGAYSYIKRKRS